LTDLLEPAPAAPSATPRPDAQGLSQKSLSPGRMAARRFRRHRAALIASIGLGLIALCAVLAPLIAPYSQNAAATVCVASASKSPGLALPPGTPTTSTSVATQGVGGCPVGQEPGRALDHPPSSQFWFGTDDIGRDLYSRVLWGARVSLFVGLAVAISSGVLGTIVGSYAGFRGGRADNLLMRVTDIFLALPLLVILLIVAQLPNKSPLAAQMLGPRGSLRFMVTLLTIIGWQTTARIVRGVVLSLKEQEFVEASRAVGAKDRWIIMRHIIPNAIGPIIVSMTFTVALAIGLESTLSYFGYGIDPLHASWGNLLADGKSAITTNRWWLVVFPSIALLITILCVNFMGDGLRDAFDPKQTKGRT
jgi:ABC-type dipeptide/oligopeptide/nickel transport system permease subunit